MLSIEEIEKLKQFALNVRRNIVTMVHDAKSGHPGGSLSGADILTVLYEKCLNIPSDWDKNPNFENRDRFILSKGHASPLLYSVLAGHGMFPQEELKTFRKINSKLQGHPSKGYVPGIEASTGKRSCLSRRWRITGRLLLGSFYAGFSQKFEQPDSYC